MIVINESIIQESPISTAKVGFLNPNILHKFKEVIYTYVQNIPFILCRYGAGQEQDKIIRPGDMSITLQTDK